MTETYIDTENAWAERDLPRVVESAVIVSAWMTDAEIAGQAAQLSKVYGNEFEVDMALRLFRAQLRSAALDAAAEPLMSEAAAVVSNMDHLITTRTTDAEIDAYAAAAEAGSGGPIFGLKEELTTLRNAERSDRVFVAETGDAPRIGNLDASE